MKKYVLRKVVGRNYLVCMSDLSAPYLPPCEINEAGVLIWEAVNSGQTVSEIAGQICLEYGITYEEAEKDVQDFLDSLQQRQEDR